jgi:hypothetical protein
MQHNQQLNLNALILLAITTYRNLGDVPSILLVLTVLSSLCRSITLSLSIYLYLSVPISFFPHDLCSSNCYANRYTRLSTN